MWSLCLTPGCCLLPRNLQTAEGLPYFRDYLEIVFDLYVLVTTANSPDVMYVCWACSPCVADAGVLLLVVGKLTTVWYKAVISICGRWCHLLGTFGECVWGGRGSRKESSNTAYPWNKLCLFCCCIFLILYFFLSLWHQVIKKYLDATAKCERSQLVIWALSFVHPIRVSG